MSALRGAARTARALLAPLAAPLALASRPCPWRGIFIPSSSPAFALAPVRSVRALAPAPLGAPAVGVRWESTRRKRMKAMTKHKYEKRQKKIRNLTALNQNKKK